MGGKCVCCGYNKCTRSLALHHLDPFQKERTLGSIRANAINWGKIVEEVKKCILVCHNCHNEIHEGITEIPKNLPTFNELYSDYKELEKHGKLDECPVCGKLKPTFKITCSRECSGKRQYKIDWDSVNLEEEIKTKSIVKISNELGCSGGAVHKRLKKLGLKL
jgi:hypothetical protein